MSKIKFSFSKAWHSSDVIKDVEDCLRSGRTAGDKQYSKLCISIFASEWRIKKSLLTSSATAALEMMALVLGIKEGDEVILPAFTFSSSATAFALRGAKLVFVDIDPRTMNIDPILAEQAVTSKTKVILVMHYAGVACDMDAFRSIANIHSHISIVEDAAQAVGAFYKDMRLGSLGRMGCYSFHETKNISCGEGGLFICNSEEDYLKGEIVREKGTNRSRFFRNEVDKYTWEDIGSSYLLSDINYRQVNHWFDQ